ncbi:MAG: hypothetical protein AB8B65_00005, partial [Kordia sp.]|uniref:hypothetical protein n=1 Tax=Kordia sp. TaxID=1965332 RepID=UPI00385B0071
MSALKLHKTYRYCISLVFLQLLLGWLFYTAFDSPETNLFEFTRIVNLWAIGIVLFSVLIFLEIKQFSKAWILPVGIILYYGSFLYIVYESYIFFRIPRVHSTNINYEIIPMYLTIPALFHALLDVIYKYFRPKGKRIENIQNLALSIIIPMFLYIFAMVIIPLFSGSNDPFLRLDMFVMKIGICIALTAFLFFF